MSNSLMLIDDLRAGRTVAVVQCGNCLRPLVADGDSVTVRPIAALSDLSLGEVVFCRPDRKCVLGIVDAMRSDRVLIRDHAGRKLGWATLAHVYGRTGRIDQRRCRPSVELA